MAIKKIAIIGGGISGLALLHFLIKKHGADVSVTLYEHSASAGGNVRTFIEDEFLFETGPNGFLTNQPETLELIVDMGLKSDVIFSAKAQRFIQVKNRLHELPTGPISFLKSSLLSPKGKYQLIKGFLNDRVSLDQSVLEYATARFGQETAQLLIDPFVSGVFAGDASKLHMASAFGKMLATKRKKSKKSHLCSFKLGMGQLTSRLSEQYAPMIKTSSVINSIEDIDADHIICSAPAYSAASLFQRSNPVLTQLLESIYYAPVAVVGLGFDSFAFMNKPKGFGYLIPSSQGKEVLGVLLESNVFQARAPKDRMMLRVILGGRRHPDVALEDVRILKERAEREIHEIYGLKKHSIKHWVKIWPKAIPQYELEYPKCRQLINHELAHMPKITLSGNYLGGVAVNDCIYNAKCIANKLTI